MAKGRKVRASRAAQGKVEFSHFPPAVHFDLIRKQAVVIPRSEERFSRNAETDLVCRLLLEKKKEMHHGGTLRRPARAHSLVHSVVSICFDAYHPRVDSVA